MALSQLSSLPTCFTFTSLSFPKCLPLQKSDSHAPAASKLHFQVRATGNNTVIETQGERRTAHFKPNIWKCQFVQSLTSDYGAQMYVEKANVLIDKVRSLLVATLDKKDGLALLELIDDIQRLGLGYHFENEIRGLLSFLIENNLNFEETLHSIALSFRLFRQHGFEVSQDVFNVFKNPEGDFLELLSEDDKGIQSLFEASYLCKPGEDTLAKARAFAHKHLSQAKGNRAVNDSELIIQYASDLPLHYNVTRLHARWQIEIYSRRKDANPTLLELAKLDYNMVQATYQKDLIELSRWWEKLGLRKKLFFARDRLVESFLWGVGTVDEPQYSYLRQGLTKLTLLITTIDDVYDAYSTYDEAKLFTEAVERWDANTLDTLPEYMKLCFFALYNTINEFAYDVLKDQDMNVLPYLKKKWVDLCRAYLVESKWFHTGYKPTLDEYLENACVSIAAPMTSIHAYVLMTSNITKDTLDYLDSNPDLIYWSAMVFRLSDDLGTSKDEMKRGDVPKSIQCYMNDAGVTEEVAREHIMHLLDEAWKKVNAQVWADSGSLEAFVKRLVNFLRTAKVFYGKGDAYGVPENLTKDRVFSLIINSVPM